MAETKDERRSGMRRRFGAVLITLLWVTGAHAAPSDGVQGIAAVVNDDVISDYDLQQRVNLFLRATNQTDPDQETLAHIRQQAMSSLVDERLELQEAKKNNVKVDDKEVEKGLIELATHNNMSYDQMQSFFASSNVDFSTLENQVRAQLIWNHLVTRKFLPQIRISDEEVTAALQQIKRNASRPERHIAEIVLHVDSPDQENRVRQTAEELVGQIRGGAQFAAVAHQYSQSASAAVGGDVGWVAAGQLSEPLEAALDTMNVGEISDPIRNNSTYTIIGFIDQRSGGDPENTSGGTQYTLRQLVLPVDSADPGARETALARAQVLQTQIKSCADMAATPEAANSLSGDLGTIEEKDLPEQFRVVLAGLDTNQVAAPFETSEGVHVLMVCDKKAPKLVEPSRDAIEDQLMANRLEMMARRYLRDLRRDAMIEYRVAEH